LFWETFIDNKKTKGNHMKPVTFLGPIGATFSHQAYDILATKFGAPAAVIEPSNCIPAPTNRDIIKLIIGHGGYGAIAMETLAEGRVAEPVESFIELLQSYDSTDACPIRIIGALRMRIHFCLMARKTTLPEIPSQAKILMHAKALGPCKKNIERIALSPLTVSSNGEAARLVAETDEYATSVALGPRAAAERYGLAVIDEAFEDTEAITTFFLVAPSSHAVSRGKQNRALVVFKLAHKPGALVRALAAFDRERLNLIEIHSVHAGNGTYRFAIEIEVGMDELERFDSALMEFRHTVDAHLSFGPFEVLSR
jgi:prephenate dehydratase